MTKLTARDHALITRFPLVFGPIDRLQPLIMYQGIAIDDGWIPLLDQRCRNLTAVIRVDQPVFQATQIKETGGQLRVHAQGGTARTWAPINAAATMRGRICESWRIASQLRRFHDHVLQRVLEGFALGGRRCVGGACLVTRRQRSPDLGG